MRLNKNGIFEMHKFFKFYLFVYVVDYCYQEQSDCFSASRREELLAFLFLFLTFCKGYVKNRCVRVCLCGVEMQFIFYSGTVLSVKSRPISIYKFNLGQKCMCSKYMG